MSERQEGVILTIDEAEGVVRHAQAAGEVVVLCHGCFDLVHPGHVRHLQHAATLGDRLLVSVTGDTTMAKGVGRPLIPQEHRAANLAALGCVDMVIIDEHPTAVPLLERLRPDVYVKGREYEHNSDPRFLAEKETVERHGGRVVLSSGDVVFSSTALIDALEDRMDPIQTAVRELLRKHGLTSAGLVRTIDAFRGRRVLVVGETIIDTYVLCDRPGLCGEGPMLSLRPLEQRRYDGGAAVIAGHLAAMGARPVLVTALPRTVAAERLRQRLAVAGVETVAVEIEQPLSEKQRFIVGTTKMMKLDLGPTITLDARRQRQLVEGARNAADGCVAAIVADYGQGLFTGPLLDTLCGTLRDLVGVLAGDVSGLRSNLLSMKGMDIVCPSEVEMREALHEFDEGLSSVAWRVLDRTRSRAGLVTLGDGGLIAFDRRREPGGGVDWRSRLTAEHVPALAAGVIDELGCGDALLAAATLTLATGASLATAGLIGSVAAAAEGRRLGNLPIGAATLRRGVQQLERAQLAHDLEPTTVMVTHPRDQLPASHA